jgi:Regulator of ribonuclease activity B
MEQSLIGRLKTMIAKHPAAERMEPAGERPGIDQPPAPKEPKRDADQLVAIEFRALVPNEGAAREIAEVSRRGSDCADAVASLSGRSDLSWQVLVTLNMIPKPETIRDNVELVALFSSRFGGRADGWQMRERANSGYLT